MSAKHYPLWRDIGCNIDDDTIYEEIEVCGVCTPKHTHVTGRAALDAIRWPCALAAAVPVVGAAPVPEKED